MSEVPDALLLNHPAFAGYDDFFYEAANQTCRGCPYLTTITNRYAFAALRQLVRRDENGFGALVVDIEQEPRVLKDACHQFRQEVGNCQGQRLADADAEELAELINSLDFFTPEFRAKTIANLLPLKEICGLSADNPD